MFPLIWQPEDFVTRDFVLLELQFSRTVLYFLPCDSVQFVPGDLLSENEGGGGVGRGEMPETWVAGMKLVAKKMQPVVNSDGSLLFLPIWQNDSVVAFGILSGGPSINYLGYDSEWLNERSRLISRELRRIKQWVFDPESGLLNGRQLREEVAARFQRLTGDFGGDDEREADSWSLFLLDIGLKARNSGQSAADIARAGACLNAFIGDIVPLNHLGSGLFGMLWNGETDEEYKKLGYALLRKLKRQNFAKVHIGIAPLNIEEDRDEKIDSVQLADAAFEEAWQSLQDARSRGPFAVCSATGQIAAKVFRPPSASISAELQKKWYRQRVFSIVLLRADEAGFEEMKFSKRIASLVGEDGVLLPENGREAYVYLPGIAGEKALLWGKELKEKINQLGDGTYSMGVASFPCPGFKKRDIPINARKAFIHTKFYGPDSASLFDGVSLNISGDVYYNEGDLAGAVREYKLGLKVDPENVNLLNSLAVIYAQVNRYRKAIPIFEQVLVLNEQNFMALFNLGFAYLRSKQQKKSLEFFERALVVDDGYFDLLLQLGQLYCDMGKFADAVTILSKAEKVMASKTANHGSRHWQSSDQSGDGAGASIGQGVIFRYLGIAFQEVGENKKAMVYYQKAIRYNARDAEALSRLGELYLVEGEGDEVALSLCRQALTIDETKGAYWYRLANVQFQLGAIPNTVDSLKQCLAFDRKNINALLLMGEVYSNLNQEERALQTYKRVLRLDGANKTAQKAIKRRNK